MAYSNEYAVVAGKVCCLVAVGYSFVLGFLVGTQFLGPKDVSRL